MKELATCGGTLEFFGRAAPTSCALSDQSWDSLQPIPSGILTNAENSASPTSLCNWHSSPPSASLFAFLPLFSFALCLLHHFFDPSPNSLPPSHLPPTNYSFKVVFRVFRDFHSVPVKPLICSNWNTLYVPMFQLEHLTPIASAVGPAQPTPLRCALQD
jgi:hypothetical protein